MNRAIFVIVAIFSLQVRADNYPFYFFALRIMNLPNVQETVKAEKELCSFITKNCELSKEKGLKFSIMKLHDGPDEKSKVVGAFVNALKDGCYGNDEEIDHCNASGKASFVVLIDGTRLSLDHYLSVDPSDINKHKFEYRIGVKEDANDYLRYVRVVDAIPKKETSFYRPSLYWYALTSPKKDNTKLWLNYNSDLRSPILTTIEFDVNLTTGFSLSCHKIFPYTPSDLKSELETVYNKEHSSIKSNSCYSAQFYICDINEDIVKLIALNVKEYHSFVDSLNEEFKLKTHTEIIKKYYSKSLHSLGCNVFPNKKSFEIPINDFYTNGFLKNSVWFNFLEDKYLYEKKVFVQDKTALSVAKESK